MSLADEVKSFHRKLRDAAASKGAESAWREHVKDEESRKRYAHAMASLSNSWKGTGNVSRIDWIVDNCDQYFKEGVFKARRREIASGGKCEETSLPSWSPPFHVLDVGSCDNPFRDWRDALVLPIDLTPARTDVNACDFLSVPLSDDTIIANGSVSQLSRLGFDIVIFSLFLEYLPSPEMRLSCCKKAYDLLKSEGLLVIATPDSNHVGSNAQLYKSWRRTLAEVGMTRVKYEKLQHLHCMMFRKSPDPTVPREWCASQGGLRHDDGIYIPQDFTRDNTVNETRTLDYDPEVTLECFQDLPSDFTVFN